jgi:hypothetical protein
VVDVHGLRFLVGLRVTAGDFIGAGFESVGMVATGLETGNANVGDADAEAVAAAPDAEEAVALGDASGLCAGLGVGEAGIIFVQ